MGVLWNIYKGLRVLVLGWGPTHLVINVDNLSKKQVQEK
jgi:hypothetical protein